MATGDNSQKPERSNLIRGRMLSHIYSEAEYVLNIPNTYKHIRPSWDPHVPTKYGIKDKDRFRISNIWTYCILSFLGCLVALGFISLPFWYPPARSILFVTEYYAGITISFLLTIAYLAIQKPLRRYFLRTSPSEGVGERRFIYIEVIILVAICILLLGFQVIWKLPFAIFAFYFLLFNGLYTFIIMFIYLMIRLQTKNHAPDNA